MCLFRVETQPGEKSVSKVFGTHFLNKIHLAISISSNLYHLSIFKSFSEVHCIRKYISNNIPLKVPSEVIFSGGRGVLIGAGVFKREERLKEGAFKREGCL